MASIAAAIEKASVQTVGEELWWDSHVATFQALDKCIARDTMLSSQDDGQPTFEREARTDEHEDDVLAKTFNFNHHWLLKTLTLFRPQTAAFRAALNTSSIVIGSHILEIESNLKDIALQASTLLELNEIQSYILASRVSDSKSILNSLSDRDLLSAVVMNYYTERQCLLKSVRLLLTCRVAEDSINTSALQRISDEISKLLKDGLEENTLNVLRESLSSVQPQHMDRAQDDLWAEETALEQTLLLDILFLLYYEPLCGFSFKRLKDLTSIFEDMVIRRGTGEILALTPETEMSLMHARRQAVLIIVEALDLENLLLMVHCDTPLSQGKYALSKKELQQLDTIMAGLNFEQVPECGPVLLSWGTFLCLVSFLPSEDGRVALEDVDHTLYIRQAYDAGAYNYLLDMLRDQPFQEFDMQVGGYKSVIKTLMSAFFTAYNAPGQIDGHDVLVDILCELYHGQETLCSELWDRDSTIDGPIRTLLFSMRDLFPHETFSLVRLLAAQCEGSWPSECVLSFSPSVHNYDFLYKMAEVTCLYQSDEIPLTNRSGNTVRTTVPLQVPDAPGLLIPAGTSGCILREFSGRAFLVRWECKHSGIIILLLRMLKRSISNYQQEEVFEISNLFNRMLSANKSLVQLVLDIDTSTAMVSARTDGRVETSLRLDVVSLICSVINALVQHSGDDAMIASCIGILTSLSLCCPKRVMTELGQSILLQPSGGFSFPGSKLHEIIVKSEQGRGCYPLTNAVLDFTKAMVEMGVASRTEDSTFSSLVLHVIGNVFVNHGNWKYSYRHEQLMITAKAIWIMRSMVAYISHAREVSSLKGALELLLYDCVVLDILLNVLAVNAHELEELHFNRTVGAKEIEWLQQAIYSVLMLLHDLAFDVNIGVCSKEYNDVTLFEQAVFRKITGSLPVVTAIATFLSFSRNETLQFASAKALTSLFLLAHKSRQHQSTLANYISNATLKVSMRSAIVDLLSEDTAGNNYLLFGAVIDLLTAAVRWQPAVVELLLFPEEHPTAAAQSSERDISKSTGRGDDMLATTDRSAVVLDALWKLITHYAGVSNSRPHLLSRVLFLLASLWEGGIEYLRAIEALRKGPQFWKQLTSCLSFGNSSITPSPTLLSKITAVVKPEISVLCGLSNDSLLSYSSMYTCEASVLSIMAHDVFLQQNFIHMGISNAKNAEIGVDSSKTGTNTTGENDTPPKVNHMPAVSGALPIVFKWFKGSQLSSIMSSYALCLYDKEVLLQAKAEARVLLVGLMGKVLSGDTRGLNVLLAKTVYDAARKISETSSFGEIMERYSTSGYSHGEQIQIMIIGDLFHHLQGELSGGRPIPSGLFQHVVDFLVSNDIDSLVNPSVSDQVPDLHPAYGKSFMYDAMTLETQLGLDWWNASGFGLPVAAVAERTVTCVQRANAMASLGQSQLSALKSWSALLTVSIFGNREFGATPLTHGGEHTIVAADWTEPKLTSYSTELCTALESGLTGIGPIGDGTNFIPSFISSQGQLLLVFVKWLSSLSASSSTHKIHTCVICAKLVHSVVGCLKRLLDSQYVRQQQGKELVKLFLGALLLILELLHSQQKSQVDDGKHRSSQSHDEEIRHAVADVALVGLGFLPSLCRSVENMDFANVAIAVINIFVKNFLAPSTWFPVLQNHFPLAASLSRMHEEPHSSKVMLNLCLSFVGLKGGAELLHSAGFFSRLRMLNQDLDEETFSSAGMGGPFSVWLKQRSRQHGVWSLGIAVVAGLVRSLGDKDPGGIVVQNAISYIQSQKDRMVSALLVPTPTVDLQHRKKVKLQPPRTSLSALQDTQHVISLICEVSQHNLPWTLKDSVFDFGEMVVHLLAFIAREGLVHPGSSIRSGTGMGFSCLPLQKDEKVAHTRPPVVSSTCAWFAVTARGCYTSSERVGYLRSQSLSKSTPHPLTLSPSRQTSSISLLPIFAPGDGPGGVQASEYSNLVAMNIYKLCFLLLRYVCQQAHYATRRVEEGGPPDYLNFTELPAPEILHGLQDQVIPVVTEICGKSPSQTGQSVCLLLLSILEMTLFLEVCVAETCGVGPLPLRSDDFSKDYKAMLHAGHRHTFLESSLQSLARIMSHAYPNLI